MCNRDRHATLTLAIGLTILLAVPGPGLAEDPLFPGPQYLTAGSGWGYPDGIVRDLNGDGYLDVVAAHQGNGTISVMLNDGTGRLALTDVYYSSAGTGGGVPIVASDMDNDDNLDLAFQDTGNPATIAVLLGNGDGTFSPGSSAAVGLYPDDIAAGDLDGDGDADLVTSNQYNSDLSVLLNNGNATFSYPISTYVQEPRCLLIVQVIGDDHLDLVVGGADPGSDFDVIWLLPGNGDGTFGAATLLELPARAWEITAENADGDGDTDLVAVVGGAGVAVLRNYGNGTFAPYESYPVTGGAGALATGDLNGDGNPDVVAKGSRATAVLLGIGNGAFEPAEMYYDFSDTQDIVALGDLDGDGDLDVVIPGPFVTVLLGNGDGTLVSGSAYTVPYGRRAVASGDLDGDGDVDLAIAGGGMDVLLNDGNGTYSEPVNYPVGAGGAPDIIAEDLDDDGDLDLATANQGSSNPYYDGNVSVFLNHGDGTFEILPTFPSGYGSCALAAGDLNGDQILDLAVANSSTRDVSVFLGVGDGTFEPWFLYALWTGPSDIAMGDLDGDGDRDLVVPGYALEGNGDGTFAWPPVEHSGGSAPIALGDLDHDGDLDLAAGNSTDDGLVVLLGNGDCTFGTPTDFYTAPDLLNLAVGDVDGDGHPDLASSQGTYQIVVLVGLGDGTFGPPMYFAAGPLDVTIDDLDGDGALDLASVSYLGRFVAVLLNQSSTIPGDLDGDGCVGHSDLAILLTDWGCGGGDCPGDCDGDGDTDHSDLAILLAHWGEGCP